MIRNLKLLTLNYNILKIQYQIFKYLSLLNYIYFLFTFYIY
jgi:hypothetical protein